MHVRMRAYIKTSYGRGVEASRLLEHLVHPTLLILTLTLTQTLTLTLTLTLGLMSARHMKIIRMNIFAFLKNMWRYEVMETPKSCSIDAIDECTFKCNKKDADTFVRKIKTALSGWEVSSSQFDSI